MIKTLTRQFYRAFINSGYGLMYAWKSQWAFRVEIILLLVAIPVALLIKHSAIELILMLSSVVLLPMLELLNSAIESTVDRISLDHHHLSKKAKDMASAAMFVAGLNILLVWSIIIFDHLMG